MKVTKLRVVLWGAILAGALFGCIYAFSGDVDGPQAHVLVEKGATLVDVRSPEEYAEGHIEGAVNIPVGDIARRAGEIPKDKPVVVYCRSGVRSARAAGALKAAGYTQVYDLGAMGRW